MPSAIRRVDEAIADCVRHARFARLTRNRVVAAFAIAEADRMNRREVDDVEAHRPRVVDALQAIAKCRAAIGAAFSGAGKNSYHAAVRASMRSTNTCGAGTYCVEAALS